MAKKKNPKQSKFVSKAQWIDCAQKLFERVKEQSAKLKEYDKANKDLIKINRENIKVNEEYVKENQELTRAYMGLHHMGKFCVEQGIDIKKYIKKLPEQNKYKDFTFDQKHTVLESGNVKHIYTITPPKKDKEGH